ncbi:pyridoxal phosphate-dependent transferase [Stachybotrys elegans]|uniref:Pyridoxal phosphate-dependent transferase n=1 Tax=Stachybotrys elegans TaxID=80388 RepID=A0A8K0SRI6_9HYPO|nr:pyridoxal phosphate-dependent transferase [Stachybotrys elegans]
MNGSGPAGFPRTVWSWIRQIEREGDLRPPTVLSAAGNQYAPIKGKPGLKKAVAEQYTHRLGRPINPDTEVIITTGANEGILRALIEKHDEVIVFEPFDQCTSNIMMVDGAVITSPSHPQGQLGDVFGRLAALVALEVTISQRTKVSIVNTPHNPVGELVVNNNVLILGDEVYDSLYYTANLSPEVFNLTLAVCSAGKTLYATGWRAKFLIGPSHLTNMAAKMARFCDVCDELGLPYSKPEGGYFVMVNFTNIKLPEEYQERASGL